MIVEDEPFIALDLAMAIEDEGGIVVGPAATIVEAMAIMDAAARDGDTVAGAILDVNLVDGDCTVVAQRLIEAGVPVVIQTGVGLPDELAMRFPDLCATKKPCEPAKLVAQLVDLVAAQKTGLAVS